jgi:type II secretory pathway component PulF
LTEALAVRTGLIPGVVLGMLRAGERGSKLAPALEQAATHLEQEAELAGRVQQALAYPLVLLVAGFVSVTVITIVVVPRFATILADLGQAMPSSTRALLLVSDALRHHGLALLAAAAIAIVGLSSWVATPHGRLQMHRLLLRLPIVGALRLGFATARMTRAIGALLGSGVPMTAALSAARESAGDQEIARRLERASERVTRGEPVAVSLRAERALTPVALQLIAVGESSGQLAAMAERAAAIATLEAEGNLRALVSLLEPALVVVFGGMVAFTAVALLQAVYSLRPG